MSSYILGKLERMQSYVYHAMGHAMFVQALPSLCNQRDIVDLYLTNKMGV